MLAVLPVPFYLLLALWIDRFEKEPIWMLIAAFVWGATGAILIAFIINTLFESAAREALAELASVATATLSAPLVEEFSKGLALVIFYFWKRDEFDNVLDGIIYAAMVGLGFAMTENILYYGQSIAKGGLSGSIFIFILRGVVSPFAHPFFTSMTGIGLGLAQQSAKGSPLKFVAPVAGLILAMALHFLWNLSASLGALFFVAYVLVMVPAFCGLLILIGFSLRHEGRIIRQHLAAELQSGLLDARGYEALCTVRGRFGESCSALGHGGIGILAAALAISCPRQRAGLPSLAHRARNSAAQRNRSRTRSRVSAAPAQPQGAATIANASRRKSGERTLAACWRRHSAERTFPTIG